VLPESVHTDVSALSLARTSDGLFVDATWFRKDGQVAYTSTGFFVSATGATRIGSVGAQSSVVRGLGAFVISEGPTFRVCDAGVTTTLPSDPHARSDELAGAFIDGSMLLAVYVAQKPVGAACTGLLGQTMYAAHVFVEQLDLDKRQAGWRMLSAKALDQPPGAGCRTSRVLATAAGQGRALAVTEACTGVDAHDSISISDCSLSAERFDVGTWSHFALATKYKTLVSPIASRDGARVAIPDDGPQASFKVYRLDHGAFAAEGAALDGSPVALDGTSLAHVDSQGKPGPSGVGFRIFVDELAGGAWHPATSAIETTGRTWTVDVSGTPTAALVDEGATEVRLYTREGATWKRAGLLDTR
jgi:hypothetical protein